MITRTVNTYKVEVKAFQMIDEETAKLAKVGEFEVEFVGKPTDTELRKAAKYQGIEIHKGYKLDAQVIASRTYAMEDAFFMANATLIK